jgi:hypothetical protein
MLPKIFLTALFASTYVAALAVPPTEGDALVVRAEAEPVAAIIDARAEVETDAVVGDELDADKVKGKKGKGAKGKKGKKGAKGAKGKKGKGKKGKGKAGKGKAGKGKGKAGKGKARKGKGSRKGKGEGRKGDRDADEA